MVTEAEVIEVIEPREYEPIRAVVPVQPGQVIVSESPEVMLERASQIATALAKMVEKQRLYTVISGKKYPHVEAWQTIGRMDNVVAREASAPVHHEDGSWEASVELIRLSDGLVIGSASALCGAAGDIAGKNDWTKRADHHKRSMAVTRATSRAFRLQYAWIMALAGYEPTPADEMPHDPEERPETPRNDDGGLIGELVAQGKQDFQLRQGPQGAVIPFRIKAGSRAQIAVAEGPLAEALAAQSDALGSRVKAWGHYTDESFDKRENGEVRTVNYTILHVERIETPDWTLPAGEAPSVAMFDE